jgi:hypothetical protein
MMMMIIIIIIIIISAESFHQYGKYSTRFIHSVSLPMSCFQDIFSECVFVKETYTAFYDKTLNVLLLIYRWTDGSIFKKCAIIIL